MFDIFLVLIIFIFGLAVGSFLNVVIARLDQLETVWFSRSHCPKCQTKLRWYDLIPLLSFILLFGRCRHCREKISWQYPLVELAMAVIATGLYWKFGLTPLFTFYFLLFTLLIIVFVYDALHQLIPDPIVWLAFLPALGILVLKYSCSTVQLFNCSTNILLGGLIVGGIPALLVFLSRETWMGKGDIKLGALLGILAGFSGGIVTLFLAFVLGAVYGIILLAGKKKHLRDAVAFGPFLILGYTIALFWGDKIIGWYL